MPDNSAKMLNIGVKNEFAAIEMKQVSLPNECLYMCFALTLLLPIKKQNFSKPYADSHPIIKITSKL